jgi:hypothetical protein
MKNGESFSIYLDNSPEEIFCFGFLKEIDLQFSL